MNKKLGIISGAGAFSGLHLYSKLLLRLSELGVKKDKDFPQIILHNYPFESMCENGIFCDITARKEMVYAIKPLSECDKIIMACNSLHCFIEEDNRFFNLPKLSIDFIKEKKCNKVLVLCSESSKENKIFGNEFNIIYLNKELSLLSRNIIERKIAGFSVDENNYMKKIYKEIKNKNITDVLIGCTELSMLNWNELKSSVNIIDSIDLAINEAIKWHKKENI